MKATESVETSCKHRNTRLQTAFVNILANETIACETYVTFANEASLTVGTSEATNTVQIWRNSAPIRGRSEYGEITVQTKTHIYNSVLIQNWVHISTVLAYFRTALFKHSAFTSQTPSIPHSSSSIHPFSKVPSPL